MFREPVKVSADAEEDVPVPAVVTLFKTHAEDAEKIKGRSSGDVLLILGYTGRTEMIHRDDLVLGGE